MKSMLYVGATLMIGASIYGFVDYKQTSQNKEFTNMYEQKSKAPVVNEETEITPTVKKEVVATVKKTRTVINKAKKIKPVEEEIIPAIAPIEDEEILMDKETVTIEESKVDIKTSEVAPVKKVKKKKLNHKIFS